MPLFVMIGRTAADAGARRAEVRPRHLEHLGAAARDGRIRLAGPLLEGEGNAPCGSLIVFEAKSFEEAEAFVQRDPYVTEGVLASWEVRGFTQVLPEPAT